MSANDIQWQIQQAQHSAKGGPGGDPSAYQQPMQPGYYPGQQLMPGASSPQGGAPVAPGGPHAQMQGGGVPQQPGGMQQMPYQPAMQGGGGQPPGGWPGMGYTMPGSGDGQHPGAPQQAQQPGYAVPQQMQGVPMQSYAPVGPDGSAGQPGCPQGMMPGMIVQTPQGYMMQTPQGLMMVPPNMMQQMGGQHPGNPGGMQFVMMPGMIV